MAQIVLGPLVANIAGSIGGSTFQRGPGIHTVRRKPNPITRRTSFTNSERSVFAFLNMNWRTLSDPDRAAWQAEADLLTWTDRFGNVIPGKGYWLYKRCNLNFHLIAEPLITAPVSPIVLDPVVNLFLELDTPAKFVMKWDAPLPTQTDTVWAIFATPPTSAGRSAAFGTYRFIEKFAPGTGSGVDIGSQYITRMGVLPQPGQRSFARIVVIDQKSGNASAPIFQSAIWV